jgi:hypothetical protein
MRWLPKPKLNTRHHVKGQLRATTRIWEEEEEEVVVVVVVRCST